MYLENRLIAMLDVLGLSGKLKTKAELIETSDKYRKLILETKSEIFQSEYASGTPAREKKSNFEIGEFVFDNLILVSHEITPETASQFSLALIRLMQKFAAHDMPLRGAIAVGDYCQDKESNVFLSNVFKLLSHEEGEQQWSGCIVTMDAEEIIVNNVMGELDLNDQESEQAYIHMPVPWKSFSGSRLCLNWMHTMCSTTKARLLNYMGGDVIKRDETINAFDFISSTKNRSQKLPKIWHPVRHAKFIITNTHLTTYLFDKKMISSAPKNKSLEVEIRVGA